MRTAWVSAAFLASLPYYCYSEQYTYGSTNNAAANGLSWHMPDVLPGNIGIEINGLLYRYTVEKQVESDLTVTVGNDGVFSETDDWSGLPANTITKQLRFENIPASNWGDGSITTEGDGNVVDAVVVYTFRVDECANPQLNPSCDGYVAPTVALVDPYDPNDDEAVKLAMQETDLSLAEKDEQDVEDEDEDEEQSRLELGLMSADSALALASMQNDLIAKINGGINLAPYYGIAINGGEYNERLTLNGGEISDNPRGFRNNLAQSVKHAKMVQQQYEDR